MFWWKGAYIKAMFWNNIVIVLENKVHITYRRILTSIAIMQQAHVSLDGLANLHVLHSIGNCNYCCCGKVAIQSAIYNIHVIYGASHSYLWSISFLSMEYLVLIYGSSPYYLCILIYSFNYSLYYPTLTFGTISTVCITIWFSQTQVLYFNQSFPLYYNTQIASNPL